MNEATEQVFALPNFSAVAEKASFVLLLSTIYGVEGFMYGVKIWGLCNYPSQQH